MILTGWPVTGRDAQVVPVVAQDHQTSDFTLVKLHQACLIDAALRRRHIDLASGTVRIQESVVELSDGSLVTGPPKSLAGRRVVSIPAVLLSEVLSHLEDFTAYGEDALVFTGPKNAQLYAPGDLFLIRSSRLGAAPGGQHVGPNTESP